MSFALIYDVFISPQAGVSKLNEAKQLVDELKRKANDQSILLAEKQSEADSALKEITTAMQVQYAKTPLPSDFNLLYPRLARPPAKVSYWLRNNLRSILH